MAGYGEMPVPTIDPSARRMDRCLPRKLSSWGFLPNSLQGYRWQATNPSTTQTASELGTRPQAQTRCKNRSHFKRFILMPFHRLLLDAPGVFLKDRPGQQVLVHIDAVGVVPDYKLAISQSRQHVGLVIPLQALDHCGCGMRNTPLCCLKSTYYIPCCELRILRFSESNRCYISRQGCWKRDYFRTPVFFPANFVTLLAVIWLDGKALFLGGNVCTKQH